MDQSRISSLSESSQSSPPLTDDGCWSGTDMQRMPSIRSPDATMSPDAPDIVFRRITDQYEPTPLPTNTTPIAPAHATYYAISRLAKDSQKPEKNGEIGRQSQKIVPAAETSYPYASANKSRPITARDRKRRQSHNASAMRSRLRLNVTLEKLWKIIPPTRRQNRASPSSPTPEGKMDQYIKQSEKDDEEEDKLGRADKVEIAIDYIIHLEDRVRELEQSLLSR
jgi:hypothetical protein